MTLLLLGIDELECIVNHLNSDEKSTLFMVGSRFLNAKLGQVGTSVSIYPYNKMEIESLSQDDSGFHITTKSISCDNFTESISITARTHALPVKIKGKIVSRKRDPYTYGLLPLYYKSAKKASLHSLHLQRAMTMLYKLESLQLYMMPVNHCKHLKDTPSTLKTLKLMLHGRCKSDEVLKCIPGTITKLSMCYIGGGHIIVIKPEILQRLPKNLVSLSGIDVNGDDIMRTLPQSLTKLKCDDLDLVTPSILPPNITHLECEEVALSTLAHLQLQTLSCCVFNSGSLLQLHSVTKLEVSIQESNIRDWTNPVQFPSSVIDLTLMTPIAICCLIPPSIKKLNLQSNHNVFELSTRTWSFKSSSDLEYIPDNVLHAVVDADYLSHDEFDLIISKLQNTVESLTISSKHFTDRVCSFNGFTNCTKLILPKPMYVEFLPPSITYLDASMAVLPNGGVIWSSTLRHLTTCTPIPPAEIRQMQLSYLKCVGMKVLRDLQCINHIPEVILMMPRYRRNDLPKLPSNAKYEFYK